MICHDHQEQRANCRRHESSDGHTPRRNQLGMTLRRCTDTTRPPWGSRGGPDSVGRLSHETQTNLMNLEAVAEICRNDVLKGCRARKFDVIVGPQQPVSADLGIDAGAGED
jgi:hypothetical protein